jgi:Sap, sulfolipid-1-addressing protein
LGDVIGNILPLALGVAISPVPIIAVILMLFSGKARVNGLVFVMGWTAGISAVFWIVYALGSAADISTSSGPSRGASILRIILGVLLFYFAYRNWRKRPKPGEEPSMPKWLSSIENFSAVKSGIFAVGLSAINPKNLALAAAAAMAVTQGGLGASQDVIAYIIFLAIAVSTVTAPVVIFLVMGDKATKVLDAMKTWLAENNATVMFVLLLVFGMVLLGKGIAGL